MPPEGGRRADTAEGFRVAMGGFVHLHVHSPYSFLDGASSIEALLDRAAAFDMPALAITDHNALSGAVQFARAAAARGIQPLIGVELTLEGGYHLTLLACNRRGYSNLCRLISQAHLRAPRRLPALPHDALAPHSEGLIALSGCRRGEAVAHLRRGDVEQARAALLRLKRVFGPRLYVELVDLRLPGSRQLVRAVAELAAELGIEPVATNDVHYARKADFPVHDVLTCVRTLTRLEDVHPERRLNAENYLKSPREMEALFLPDLGRALTNAAEIALQCDRQVLPLGEKLFPAYPLPPGQSAAAWLRRLTFEGAQRRYGRVSEAIRERLEHELAIIEKLGVEDYFLVMWDIVNWARGQGIRTAGRGSAADCAVAYCLGLTDVDAIGRGLLFERFLSLERAQPPDIDIDFDARRRDEVAAYVYRRFGDDHVASVATYQTFQARSAIRELGKAMGLPDEELDALARRFPYIPADAIRQAARRLPEIRKSGLLDPGPGERGHRFELLFDLAESVAGFPRHLGTHLGGLIISRQPIADLVPLQMAAKGVVIAQFDKDDVEAMGFIKLDLLSLRTLGAVDDAIRLIARRPGAPDVRFESIPLDDPATYRMLHRGETVGAFQLESPAQRALQRRLGASHIEDIVASVALIRPGPIKGDMVEPFLARRRGEAPVVYPHPDLERILKKTYGVVLYQEQVIEIATVVAGFTPGESDRLRRAMTHFRSHKEMEAIGELFVAKATARGVEPGVARSIFSCILGYAGYGFCEAHAAAFADTAYKTAYLLRHYPAEFFAALLNNQPMGFYPPHTLVLEARRRGVQVLGPDVNASEADYTVLPAGGDGQAIRVPLKAVRELGEQKAAAIIEERRRGGPFHSLFDFCRRLTIARDGLEALILAGAFDSLHPNRRALLWNLPLLLRCARLPGEAEGGLPVAVAPPGIYGGRGPGEGGVPDDPEGVIDDFSDFEKLALEFYAMGFSPDKHFLAFLRPRLHRLGVRTAAELDALPEGQEVEVAGLVVRPHRPPTRSGRTVVFLTLEDETGLADVTVFEGLYQREGQHIFTRPALIVRGIVQRRGEGASLVARAIRPLPLRPPR